MRRLLGLGALSLVAVLACAHGPHTSGLKGLKETVDIFYERVRWNDFVGTSQMVIPALRKPYLKARDAKKDDKELTITEYEVLDVQIKADAIHGVVMSRISWTRLPSVSVQTQTVTSEFVFQGDNWYLDRMEGGPFNPELLEPPEADGGIPQP